MLTVPHGFKCFDGLKAQSPDSDKNWPVPVKFLRQGLEKI